jgi:hypothetical protein
LTGAIPSLSGLTALQGFNVGGNQLTGAIPAPPGSLSAGYWGDLCGNSLVSSGNPAVDAAWDTAQGSDWLSCQIEVVTNGVTEGIITGSIANVTSTIAFNSADVGQIGSVFVTALVPRSFLNSLAARTSANSSFKAMVLMAAENPDALVLVQLASSGWYPLENGQLLPLVEGVLDDQLATQTILKDTDTKNLIGSQICAGYGIGTDASEMISAERMQLIATIPDPNATYTGTWSCNVTIPISADEVFAYAEAIYSDLFPGIAFPGLYPPYNYRHYPDSGYYLAIDTSDVIYLLGPSTNNAPTAVGPVESFRSDITNWKATVLP